MQSKYNPIISSRSQSLACSTSLLPFLQLVWTVVVAGLRQWIAPRLVNKAIIRGWLRFCLCTDRTLNRANAGKERGKERTLMMRFHILMHVGCVCLNRFKWLQLQYSYCLYCMRAEAADSQMVIAIVVYICRAMKGPGVKYLPLCSFWVFATLNS